MLKKLVSRRAAKEEPASWSFLKQRRREMERCRYEREPPLAMVARGEEVEWIGRSWELG
jgi:hypothetical protein